MSTGARSSGLKTALAIVALASAVAVSYHGSLSNGFAWDDNYIVLDNPSITDLSAVPGLFASPWAKGVDYELGDTQNRAYYRPLALASMAFDWAIAGPDPAMFHLTNMLIHLVASLFLFAWLRSLLALRGSTDPDPWPRHWLWPLGIAIVYAVHPVHTEAVNLVSYRTTLLSGSFVFGTLWAFTARPQRTIPGLLLFAAAVLSKETGLVAAGLLFVQDVFFGRIDRKRLAQTYLPVFLVSIAYLAIRSQVTAGGIYSFFGGLDPLQGALMIPRIFFLYVRLCLFPHPLCPFYDWNVLGVPGSVFEPDILAGIVLLPAFIASAILLRRRVPLAAFGFGFFLVALVPVSHLVPFFDAAGERFLYVPLAGFLLAVAGLAGRVLSSPLLRKFGIAVAILAFGSFVVLTNVRTAQWTDSETILETTVRDFPGSLSANLGLGRLLLDEQRPADACESLRNATRIAPTLVVAHGLLAAAQGLSGEVDKARSTLMQAPFPESGMPTAAQIARKELMSRRKFRLMARMGL